ncbi:hypothetical protein [Pseudomonas fontis]|uniref:DUF3077 domain-containing protein n=1 Tax=Pseudomonas fontis TaxID=2942633 RepID=A0ABT5NS78_9PSED|nr:hypothetical protein [Pseudomonas fontis]MDD0977673.1 hypothetical protein [Pseudomonas fontis]MDD0991035.1 hypothetical protein [Pseudomonas fontis]
MKKIVPDPPLAGCQTTQHSIGHCSEHDDIFCVAPGIGAEDAPTHVAMLLKCANITCTQAIELGQDPSLGFMQCTQQSVELAYGLINALLDGVTLNAPQ